LFAADGSVLEARLSSSATTLVGFDDGLAGTVARVRLRARLNLSGALEIGSIGAGDWELSTGGQTFHYQLTLTEGGFGEAVLAPPAHTTRVVLTGDDLVEATVVLQTATHGEPLAGVGLFGLIARPAPRDDADAIASAARAAAAADVAVVVVGLTEEQETESVDKHTLHLPGGQDELIRAVAAAARKTVVVVNAATPVIMPWLNNVDAVLWAGLPGQEGGRAVAAALLGEIEPAGRLVTTFPSEDGAAPAWSVTPVNGQVQYHEGPFIGYRGHAAGLAPEPVFWFGHGLGYTTWEYSDASLEPGDRAPVAAVTITNSGSRQSREVVQVYFRPASTDQPIRLVGWTKVTLAPGQSTRAVVHTEPRMWRRWNTAADTWDRIEAGGQLVVARGLGDIRAILELPR
jgi:beta-glucosidase